MSIAYNNKTVYYKIIDFIYEEYILEFYSLEYIFDYIYYVEYILV